MDYEKDPVGVEEMPQFSWKLKSDKRNVDQSAYRLQIAENRDFQTPVYDSEGSKAVNLPTSARQGQRGLCRNSQISSQVLRPGPRMDGGKEESGWCCGEFADDSAADNRE